MKEWDKNNPAPTHQTIEVEIDNPAAGEPYEPKIPPKPEVDPSDKNYKQVMYNWEQVKKREEQKATLIDKDGKPLKTTQKTQEPLPTKKGKVTTAGKKSEVYKEWERKRDEEEYNRYREEFYQSGNI
jgi:hypothetical protein